MAAYMIQMFVLAALAGGYAYSLIRRIMKFYGLDVKKNQFKTLNIALAIAATFSCVNLFSTSAMVVLHILVTALVLDLAELAVQLAGKNRQHGKAYKIWEKVHGCGLVPVVITCAIFVYGFINMNHVIQTEYTVTTDKKVGSYKIVLITDTHYGTIQDTDILKEKVEEINAQNPDIVILGGDIVEEGTTKEMMQEVFSMFGGMKSQYGVYYVYGNHDRQPYTNNRSYTDEELENAILAGGITILEDGYTEINDDLVLVGRGDAAWGNVSGRASTEEILEGVDRNKYIILADHQPIEAEENDAQGVDLELSGHTHAGQIWPTGLLTELSGGLNYGKYQVGNCNVVVSSGFAGWGYPIRTGKHSEYVIVTIQA
jgi:hypothetical protein